MQLVRLVLAVSTFFVAHVGASAQDASLRHDIVVATDREKLSGQVWDGIGGSGRAGLFILQLPQPMAPPDLALCIVPPEGAIVCHGRHAVRDAAAIELLPRCQDRFTCVFRDIALPSGAFGLIVLDLDESAHDLVDMAVVMSEPEERTITALAARLRALAQLYAPAFLESTLRSRENDIEVISISGCSMADRPCRLVQSTLAFVAP